MLPKAGAQNTEIVKNQEAQNQQQQKNSSRKLWSGVIGASLSVSLSWSICPLHTPRVYIRNIFPKALLLQTLLLFEPIIVIFSWSDSKWQPRRPDGRLDAQTAVWTPGRPSGRPNGRQEAQTAVWTTKRLSRRPNGRLDAQMAV